MDNDRLLRINVKLSKSDITTINNYLELRGGDNGETLSTFSIRVIGNIEVDFNVVNSESGPYLDVILFDNGCEVTALPPDRMKIEGDYTFDYDGTRIVIVIGEATE